MNEYDIGIVLLSIIFGVWQYWNVKQILKLRKEVIFTKKKLVETREHFINFASEYNRLLGIRKEDKND